MTLLSSRALNRASLARQYLLEPADVGVLDAVAHLGGLQAQEPQEPFVGLWSRLRAFDPSVLSGMLVDRRVVRTHLMRRTVHLVTAEDALAWRSRHDPMLLQRVLAVYRRELADVDLAELTAAAAEVMSDGRSRTMPELGRALAETRPGLAPRPLGELAVAVLVPMVQVPPRGLWRAAGGAQNVPLSAWLGRAVDPPAPEGADPVGEQLVRRYLAAFGPAATAGLPRAVAAVRDELVAFRDDRVRELLDLPDAPRPDPDTPAPVRFLPAFDNAILGYDDRSRIVDDVHRGLSVAGERAVLVDGRVAATWTVEAGTVHVTPLRPFTRQDRSAVAEQGRDVASFLSDGEHHGVRVAASPR